ncbi:MAG: InlB B-repeat-containing protein [Spirochaetaceae bacterium]|nr:InlB B-repeat-containing protein [Spirochaetaceae bacterium]
MKRAFFCITILTLLLFSCETTYTDYYKVSVDKSVVGGKIYVPANQFRVGHMVEIEITPDPGQQFETDSLCYYTSGGTRYGIHGTRFHMPDSDITIFCKFIESSSVTTLEVKKPGGKVVKNGSSVHFVGSMPLSANILQSGVVLSSSQLEWYSDKPTSISVDKNTGNLIDLANGTGEAKITARLSGTDHELFSITAYSYPEGLFPDSPGSGEIKSVRLGAIGNLSKLYIPDCINGVATVALGDNLLGTNSESPSERRTSINELYIPSTVTTIGKSAFYGLASLATVRCHAAVPPQLAVDVFSGCGSNFVIRVPNDQINAYKVAINPDETSSWSVYASRITGLDTYSVRWGTIRGSNKEGVVMDDDTPVISNPGTISLPNQRVFIDTSMADAANTSHPNRTNPVITNVTAGERVYVSLLPNSTQQYAPEEETYRLNWTKTATDPSRTYADMANGYTSFIMPEHDIYLNCTYKWAKTDIALDLNGGKSPTTSVVATYGEPITFKKSDRPLREGYIFEGYFFTSTSAEGVVKTPYCNQNMGSSNTWYSNSKTAVLTAEWEPYMATLQINNINADEASGLDDVYSVRVSYGEDMPQICDTGGNPIEAPTRSGYEFKGYVMEDGTMYYDKALRSVRKWDQGGVINEKDDGTYEQVPPASSYMLFPWWVKL